MFDYGGGTIIAIDPDSNSGLAIGEPGTTPRLFAKGFRHDNGEDARDLFRRATGYFAGVFRDEAPSLVVIEGLVPSQNFWTSKITMGMYAIITGIAGAKGIAIEDAPVSTWRKYVLGEGRMKGKEAKRRAQMTCRALKWDFYDDHNVAEAACIWLWACAMVAPKLVQRVEPLFLQTHGGKIATGP